MNLKREWNEERRMKSEEVNVINSSLELIHSNEVKLKERNSI